MRAYFSLEIIRPHTLTAAAVAVLGGLLLAGCAQDRAEAIATAYVAPATLNVGREIGRKNNNVAVLTHGEKVSIVDVRRRFVKIRTRSGAEGWVDAMQLLSQEQMDEISRETQHALTLPSEGSAGVYEPLNIHITPNRLSPAFARIPEGGTVAVLAHRLEPKTPAPLKLPNFAAERPAIARKQRKERQLAKGSSHLLPSLPPPPKPPPNWQQLSAERIDGGESTADRKKERDNQAAAKAESNALELKKPVVMEDWTLVRTKDKQCGWVLSRNLVMSIPDEVAQYAEGKRITSYFDLGSVPDEEKGVKHNWLWTTLSEPEAFDFDGWRVFIWNRRRHRYETSYRQRDLEGYYPVRVYVSESDRAARNFKLVTKDEDGKFRQRTYLFDGSRVHLTAAAYYNPAAPEGEVSPEGIDVANLQSKAPQEGWFRRQWHAILSRLSRKH